ncbi:MAG: tryptophan halogenase family protein [Parvularcula sp.]
MTDRTLRSIAIVGGGSAGWMTAAAIVNAVGDACKIRLIESDAIGIVGVGEATIPPIKIFNQQLGIDEATFVRATQGTFKLGIEFTNWRELGESYFHPFGSYGVDFDSVPLHYYWLRERAHGYQTALDEHSMAWGLAKRNRFGMPQNDPRNVLSTYDYAYHFDAALYGQFLRQYSEQRGVLRTEGRVDYVHRNPDTGHIEALQLDSGESIAADFFIDCTGFRGLLIEDTLKTGYKEWSKWLPCDRAAAIPTTNTENLLPYTRSIAREAGWQWRIPLQHRIGNGHVYASDFTDDDRAVSLLMDNLEGEPLADSPRLLRFTTGHRKKFWNGNCLAIGLSAGFLEPLESTSLHLIQSGIMRLLALFPDRTFNPHTVEEYNRLTQIEYERVRDFIILHYKATDRQDADLWRYTASMDIPDTLQNKIEHFRSSGHIIADEGELFRNPSWLAVYVGQGILPEESSPLANLRTNVPARQNLAHLADTIANASEAQMSHAAFIDKHCKAPERLEGAS